VKFAQLERFGGALRGTGVVAQVAVAGRSPSLLALHGFGCVPDEVELLTSLGVELGLRTVAPLLPGHGSTVQRFSETRYPDWFAAAEKWFLELSAKEPVILGGQSMGALLALDLASRHPTRTAALVLFANAIRLASPFPGAALTLARWLHLPDFALPKWSGPDLQDPVNRALHTTYEAQPMFAARSLQQAGENVLQRLTRIKCPAFIAHGALDRTTPPSNAWLVADHLGTTDVEVHLLPNSGHILTKDLDREVLVPRVRTFLERVVGSRPGPAAAR
jgi:carboxylesterase